MTDDPVERLARVLYEAHRQRHGGVGPAYGDVLFKKPWLEMAREAMRLGVTLSAPAVAPSPLEAAANELAELTSEDVRTPEQRKARARELLAAAVGALTTAQINKLAQDSSHAYACDIRAALLAALTEEGK